MKTMPLRPGEAMRTMLWAISAANESVRMGGNVGIVMEFGNVYMEFCE